MFILLPIILQAQNYRDRKATIDSEHLGELREIQISIPKDYDPTSDEKLDVLYVLDGEWAASITKTACSFLGYAEFIPTNMLIVSIPNFYENGINRRRRDFIPMESNGQSISQGALNFQLFLKEELVPWINSQYDTNPENNILYGSSLGGLFTIYTFLKEPTLFKSYLAIEPVLQYADHYINRFAKKQLQRSQNSSQVIWISSREGKPFKAMGSSDFKLTLSSQAPAEVHWKVATYPNETHFSMIWKGLYDGLKFMYKQ